METLWAALIGGVAAVLAAIGGFSYVASLLADISDVSVQEVVVKATISSLVVVGAGFMSHESSGHRKEARDARRTQLDLNALDPFLTKLNEDEANDLRREFAQKIFGRPLANDKNQKPYEWILNAVQRPPKAPETGRGVTPTSCQSSMLGNDAHGSQRGCYSPDSLAVGGPLWAGTGWEHGCLADNRLAVNYGGHRVKRVLSEHGITCTLDQSG